MLLSPLLQVPVYRYKAISVEGSRCEGSPFFTITEVNMADEFIPAFPDLLSADARWKDVQHVSFFQGGAFQIAQGDTVQ